MQGGPADPGASAPGPASAPNRWVREAAYAATVLAVALALAWTALCGWKLPEFGGRQLDFYNLLVAGFRKGSLALDIEVPAALKNAADPVALFQKHPEIGGHDLSLYHGHFYTYYGVAPAVVLFWPFRILTGRELPLTYGCLLFAYGGLLLTAWLWRRVLRDHYPRSSILTESGGLAVLTLAAGQWVLLRRIGIWEPSLVAGHCFLMGMLAAGYQAMRSRRPALWLALAGLALGIATGSRPTLVVAGLGLVPLVWMAGPPSATAGAWPRRRRAALAVLVPLGAVGLLLLWYNWARFGDPLELGLKHQLSTWNGTQKSHFLVRYLPFNGYLYFLASPQWGRYFPFVHPIAMPALPAGYYGYEYVYGALIMTPVLWWLAAAAGLARNAQPRLRTLAACLLGVAAATTPVILCFDTAAARYATDFIPYWTWLALLSWAALEARLASRRGWLGLARTGFGLTALYSCATAFFCSADLHGILHFLNPGAEQELTGIFDLPTRWWEELSGFRGGPLAMDITFASRPQTAVEPLLVTGVEYQRDYVYVYYQTDRVVRLCYAHPGEPTASTADIPIVPGRTYSLVIDGGELYPPAGDPVYRGWIPAEVASRKHSVELLLDGKVVLQAWQGANECSPGALEIGTDRGGFSGRRFSGTIAHARRLGFHRTVTDVTEGSDFAFDVAVPKGPQPLALPLLEYGRAGSADIAGLEVRAAGGTVPVYESYGAGIWRGPPLSANADGTVSLRVRIGAMLGLAPDEPDSILTRTVSFWQADRPVWWRRSPLPVPAREALHLLKDGVGSTTVLPDFVGHIASVRRLPILRPWRPGSFGALRLELGGRGDTAAEPLLSTGHAGHADVLGIEWLPRETARLIYDHWGLPLEASAPFPWSARRTGTFRIEAPALGLLGSPATNRTGDLRVDLDGRLLWRATLPAFGAPANEIAVGRNPARSSSVTSELRAAVLDLVQEP